MRCLICHAGTDCFVDAALEIESYCCPHCGTIFKDPQIHQTFSLQKQRYDLHENDPSDEGYRHYFQHFLDWVLPQVGGSGSALDFGCGSSTLLADMLTGKGWESTAYDPIYHPEKGYRNTVYDLITVVEVFEHLHDPDATFGMLVGLLKKEGYLAIRTEFVPGSTEVYLHWYYRQDPTHVVFFSPGAFDCLCARWGCIYVADNSKNMLLVRKVLSGTK